MHIVREPIEVGRYKYKVYDWRGALIYIGESAGTAQTYYERGEADELQRREYAKLRRNAESSGSSDSDGSQP